MNEDDIITITAKEIEDKDNDYFRVIFDLKGIKMKGTVVSISSHGEYKVKVEGKAYD